MGDTPSLLTPEFVRGVNKGVDDAKSSSDDETSTLKDIIRGLEGQIKDLTKVTTIEPSAASKWISTYLRQLFLYLPNALVLFGFIMDSINQEFRYSLASIIGLGSVLLNWLISKLLSLFVTNPVSHSIIAAQCTVPGFESLESFFSPQGIVLPSAIFTYLLIDLGFHRKPLENAGTAFLMFGFLFAQAIVMIWNKCFQRYYFTSSFVTILLGMLVGAFSGWIGWIGVRYGAPQRLPSATGSISPSSNAPMKNPLGAPSGTPDVGTCSPPNDQDQFVCEAYKDGEVVTSTIIS